jgi:hypothetical protein
VCEACDVVCTGSGVDCGVALQAKLNLGGTVRVCPGRYIGTFSFSATSTEVIGAGDGRDQASNTILDADEAGRVVTVPQDVAVTLRGVRMTGGSLPTGVGGGIRTAGTLSLVSCTIRGNVASQGGGIYHSGTATGPLELADCQVVGNSTTSGSGGGIYGSGGQPIVLSGCVISGNRSGEFGGGIAKAGGSWIIAGSAIDANEAAEFGGGIYNSGPLTFDSASSITNNTADTAGTGAVGGGIYNSTGAVELNGAIVSGNEPDQCAGGGAVPGCPA